MDNGGLMQEATTEDMVLKVLRQYITICGTDGIIEAESSITLGHKFDIVIICNAMQNSINFDCEMGILQLKTQTRQSASSEIY